MSPDDGFMVIVAERASPTGQRLEAYIEYYQPDDGPDAQVTPAVASRTIELALVDGWQSESRGLPPFRLRNAQHRVWSDETR